jgi:tetratricopeptide (TPR) repeat protein
MMPSRFIVNRPPRQQFCGESLRRIIAAAAFVVVLSPPAAGAVIDDRLTAGLDDLHRGLYNSAEQTFRAVATLQPGDPEPLFLVSFSRWWRIQIERTDRSYSDPVFDQAIEEVIREGRLRLEENPDDFRSMAAVGGAHILRAHVEALRKNYFRGAREARHGKKLLEKALERDPDLATALFPLGAFNYYADMVPLIVKGIRLFLFLPGGDAELGLGQLRTVAVSASPLRTDARLLLSRICGSRDERSFHEAILHLELALRDNPDSPVVLAALGDIHMNLGKFTEAGQYFEQALECASGESEERPLQRGRLRLAIAESRLAEWRLDEAATLLADRPFDPDGSSPALSRRRQKLLAELGDKRTDDAARRNFLAGRESFRQERYAEALARFDALAVSSESSPPWMEGWRELFSGMAAARLGDDRAARKHLRRASEVGGFRCRDRARDELQVERPANPACVP